MRFTPKNRSNYRNIAYLVAFVPVCAAAGAESPLVQCKQTVFDGVPACVVDMASYAATDGLGAAPCPAGVTSTASTLLCEQSFAAAIHDAKLFYSAESQPGEPYVIRIDSGSYDLSSQTALIAGSHGVIDVTGVAPSSAGCLTATAPLDGNVALSGNACLVVSGAGRAATLVTTATGISAIFGKAVSHVMFENMTMIQPNLSTSQGTYVRAGTRTIRGNEYRTLTLDMAADFPTPRDLYRMNCVENGHDVCSKGRLSAIERGLYMRAFTNNAAPQLILSTSAEDSNAEYSWGYPSESGHAIAAVPPIRPDRVRFPRRWTLTSSMPAKQRAVPSYYSATTDGVANLICMKVNNAQAFWFDDIESGGTDIIMNNLAWTGAGRGTFRGVSGAPAGNGLGAQVYNAWIERGPPVRGEAPCLATQSGGLQFGQPDDPPIYGNLVYGLKADGTGDDSVAMFNDVGGTANPAGGLYPPTVIAHSTITNSFARDILLANNHRHSGLTNSPVRVDAFTRSQIENHGNCDPLVLGPGNCPITHVDD